MLGAAHATFGAPAAVRAQARPKLRIGYWPVASGLPFLQQSKKGYFKGANLDVEAQKSTSAQQVVETMQSGARKVTPMAQRSMATRPLRR